MFSRSVVLGFGVGVLLSLAPSCGGPMNTGKKCDPAACQGCCAESGDCLSGTALFACGTGGEACVSCMANETCSSGVCALFENGDYDASFPELPDGSIRYDAGTYRPPDSGVVTSDAGMNDAGPMNVSYSAQVQPIFDSRCDACHTWNYDTIVGVNGRVTPGNLNGSAIYTRTLSGDMPRSGGPLTGTQQNLIRDWILNGAPRN